MITKVPSFQTSDGKLHADKSEALIHELKINIKGLIQSDFPAHRTDNFTSGQIAEVISHNMDEFVGLIHAHKRKMRYATEKVN